MDSGLIASRCPGMTDREILPPAQSNQPDGQISSHPVAFELQLVQPPPQKYFCFSEIEIRLYDSPSRPTEGRWPSSLTRGGMRWTRQCPRARCESQGGFYRSVSGHKARRRTALKRTAKSCGPDASVVGVKPAEACHPNRALTAIFAGDGVKQARSPGRVRYKP
jgi:hypothetical protein